MKDYKMLKDKNKLKTKKKEGKEKDLKTFIVEKEEEGNRIDSYLAKKDSELSRVTIQRLIKEEKILVNGKKTKSSYKVCESDSIILEEEKPKEIELKAENIPIEILYEDKDIIVVNKPKGIVVHPGNRKPRWDISKCFNEYM